MLVSIGFTVISAVTGFTLGLWVSPKIAQASTAEHVVGPGWSYDALLRVDSAMLYDLAVANATSEAEIARQAWNGVSSTWFDFSLLSAFDMSNTASIANVPSGYVYVTDSLFTDSKFGLTHYEVQAGVPHALVEMDNGRSNWRVSAASTLPAGMLDFRSSVMHELGHALGFKASHVNVNCTSILTAQTMCGTHLLPPTAQTAPYRSLESHEIADFRGKYPA